MQDPTSPARKRRRRRKEARPGEIIAAALKIWIEQGFAATRLEDIARSADIAKGTIYLYFPSKEALFEAALKDRLIAMMDRADAMAQDFEGNTEELLNRFFMEVHTQLTEGGAGAFLKILVAEGHRFPELVAFYKANVIARGVMAIRAILARGVARGELQAGAEDTDPRLILAPALVGTIWSIVFGDASMPTTRETLRSYARIIIGGLVRS
jgi:TetR/AcrR family transcriptional regulator